DVDSTETPFRYLGYAARLRTLAMAGSRYLAYTSDVGEAFRPVVPRSVVNAAYGISFAYVGADIIYEGYKSHHRGDSQTELARAVTQRTIFQGLASLLIPAISIHTAVDLTAKALRNSKPGMLRTWGPTTVGLLVIPAMPLVDHPVESAVEYAFDA
ncbi:mitochondrial 18kDa protein, partial [Entophlyctis helioformis]